MKYVIPFDFSDVSKNALHQTLKIATHEAGEIHLIHFVDDNLKARNKELELDQLIAELKTTTKIISHVVEGNVFDDLGKLADVLEADFILMGTHGVNRMQKIFGSNSVKIIKHAAIPVIVIQEERAIEQIKKIIMPISIEKKSMQVLRSAVKISKIYDAEIHLVGRLHTDEFLKHKENTNVILANQFLVDSDIKHTFKIVDVDKSKFLEYVINYAHEQGSDLIATAYYSDSLMPMFDKFVQNLIVNEHQIPVMSINAQSLSKIDSTLSFMTV